MIALGLMSGTSLDGIDAALVDIRPHGAGYRIRTLHAQTTPYDAATRARLLAALPPHRASVEEVAALHRALGDRFAQVASALGAAHIDFVASHGQTLWHDGPNHITLQIGDPFALRDALKASVCFDFRSADCAAGGQGAPLVPYVDALLFADAHEDRVTLNLGGIANLTLLPADAPVRAAFDAGPGNMVIDRFVERRTGERFDADGALARRGSVDREMLAAMLADPYFALAPPKTTGRERFGEAWLRPYEERLDRLGLEDGCATLAELTAASVADAIARSGFARARVLVSGGGAANGHLMERLRARLPDSRIEDTRALGIDPNAKEAIAFAVLGYETLRGRCANVPAATGAERRTPLGAIAPFALRDLLERIEHECASAS